MIEALVGGWIQGAIEDINRLGGVGEMVGGFACRGVIGVIACEAVLNLAGVDPCIEAGASAIFNPVVVIGNNIDNLQHIPIVFGECQRWVVDC